MPTVSVIIPNYNHAVYLKERIDTILSQTYQDFELIILDDSSTDHSRTIIDIYRNHPAVSQIIYNDQNSGSTFKQWEKGISLAQGKYIWIAESDDWCEPTLLENLVEGLINNSDVGVAFCQSCFVLNPDKIIEITTFPYYKAVKNGKWFLQEHMLERCKIVNASMVLWRKELYYKINWEHSQYKLVGDWLFWVLLLNISDVYICGKILNYFRKHNQNITTSYFNSGKFFVEDFKLYEYLFKSNIIVKDKFITLIKMRYLYFLNVRKKIDPINIPIISAVYGKYIHVDNFSKLYYIFRIWLYSMRQKFGVTNTSREIR